MKKQILKWSALLAFFLGVVPYGYSQSDLGVDCGCPPVANRTTVVNMSTLCDANQEITSDVILTCDKIWVLDEKVYVPDGKTITIMPGTLIKGQYIADPAQATALIIERGGKIYADGLKECPIVFTAMADPLDGSYPIVNKGQWGGIVILGKASNNLTYAKNNNIPVSSGGKGGLCVSDGVGYIEGFDASNVKNNFGGGTTPNDNDNSGIMRYVSIRHAGAILPPGTGNELNSLSLGSVGRGTILEHIETIAGADDNIELFGGTVNLKYCDVLFGWDDMLDYDLGWTGKCQFYFGIKTATNDTLNDADNGIEADADDQKSNNCPRSHPVIYNMTLIGNNKLAPTVDNTGPAGIMAKEKTEGEIYNSIFCNFRFGLNLEKTQSGRLTTKSCDSTISGLNGAYDNWNANLLIIKNNTFIGNHVDFRLDKLANVAPSAADLSKFSTDGNVTAASVPNFNYIWDMNHTTNNVSVKFDAVPNPVLASTIVPPADGFFKQVNFRGAFSANDNWLNDWSYAKLLHVTGGLVACPGDLNNSGAVDVNDFNVFLGTFGNICQ